MLKKLRNSFTVHGRKKYFAAVLPVLIAGGLFAYTIFGNGNTGVPNSPSGLSIVLSGFEPNAQVELGFIEEASEPVRTSARITEDGTLNVPVKKDVSSLGSKIIYDFSVRESKRQVKIIMHHDLASGKVSIEGSGGRPFSEIELGVGTKEKITRTDWAGLFSETGIAMEADPAKEASAPLRLAFSNMNTANDASNYKSPSVIEILTAPGGGQLNDPVNVWVETICAPYPLSTCNTSAVNAQNDNIIEHFVRPMQLMTEQLTAVGMQQVMAIGTFLDAKQQLENQRTHQMLKAEAVKDYHPSEQMCRIGSYVRSLPSIEQKRQHDQFALNDILIEHSLNRVNTTGALGGEGDYEHRLTQFKETYCNPFDNNGALDILCTHAGGVGAIDKRRINSDIDYARTLETPYTLDIDFSDSTPTDTEEDIVALGRNLYWPDAFVNSSNKELEDNKQYYMRARALRALNNLAHNSFSHYVAMKSKAPDPPAGVTPGWAYMKTLMREMISPENPPPGTGSAIDRNIERMIGENPSYYAQMDILTKKIFQNPNFYTNLYDKPANIDRINASLEAISIMQMRDHYLASLRREMLMSGLIENQIITDAEVIQGELLAK